MAENFSDRGHARSELHSRIHYHQAGSAIGGGPDCACLGVFVGANVVAHGFEHVAEQATNEGVILDHENAEALHAVTSHVPRRGLRGGAPIQDFAFTELAIAANNARTSAGLPSRRPILVPGKE